jgi:hypothetical protein
MCIRTHNTGGKTYIVCYNSIESCESCTLPVKQSSKRQGQESVATVECLTAIRTTPRSSNKTIAGFYRTFEHGKYAFCLINPSERMKSIAPATGDHC